MLGANQYGKAEVRLVRVTRAPPGAARDRGPQRHLAAARRLRGLPHRGRQQPGGRDRHPEEHRLRVRPRARRRLARAVPDHARRPLRRRVPLGDAAAAGRPSSTPGSGSSVDGAPHDHSFVRTGRETRTAVVQIDGDETFVVAGLKDCVVLKSTGSEFHGFPRDRYTTLAETDDRILATSLTASWRYADARSASTTTAPTTAIRQTLLETFASVHSLALQQTIFAMGKAVLRAVRPGRRDQAVVPQQAPLPGRPRAVRPRQPGRGLLRRRPPLRADRGHGRPGGCAGRAAGVGMRVDAVQGRQVLVDGAFGPATITVVDGRVEAIAPFDARGARARCCGCPTRRTSCRGSSTPTCTSTSPAARSGRGS